MTRQVPTQMSRSNPFTSILSHCIDVQASTPDSVRSAIETGGRLLKKKGFSTRSTKGMSRSGRVLGSQWRRDRDAAKEVWLDARIEVNVLTTQSVIEALAVRIELAYRRRRPGWRDGSSTPRVWQVAAETLIRAGQADLSMPLDPELFVASQPCTSAQANPWNEVTGLPAVERYKARVAEIVRVLRDELIAEIRHVETRSGRGESIANILHSRTRRLSPLGRYIVAHRAGRLSLANRFVREALEQHRSCPLYRQAVAGLLAPEAYPTLAPDDSRSSLGATRETRKEPSYVCWN